MWLKDRITVGMLVKATTAHDFSLVLISDLCTNGCCFWCYSQHLELKLSLWVFLFIHTSLPSLANTYLVLKEITDADTRSVAVHSYYGEDARAALVWGLPLPWERGLWQGTGCCVVRGPAHTLQGCSGRARSGGCMLKAALSSYQWNSCPETCPGAETRAVCSPFGANIVRRLPLPAAGPFWAQRPNRGLHSPAQNMHAQPWTRGGAHHLPGIVMPPSNSTSCAHWCFWPESRGSCYMWGFGWDETEVPGLHLAGPQRDPCLLTPTRTPFCI